MLRYYSIFCLIFAVFILQCTAFTYSINVKRYSSFPIISKDLGAKCDYYSSAALYTDDNNNIGVIVEGQKASATNSAFYHSTITFKDGIPVATQPGDKPVFNISNVMSYPTITKYNDLYYVLFANGKTLNAAITSNPKDPNEWINDAISTPSVSPACAASLFSTKENKLPKNYLFWSGLNDTSVYFAYSPLQDTSVWTYGYQIFARQYSFDEYYVQPGNPPLQLKTGEFFHVYNGYGVGNIWSLGYVVLDKTNPYQVNQRSNVSILPPKLDWETGKAPGSLLSNSIYLTGLLHDTTNCPEENDWTQCFFGLYSGASAHIGALKIVVSWQ